MLDGGQMRGQCIVGPVGPVYAIRSQNRTDLSSSGQPGRGRHEKAARSARKDALGQRHRRMIPRPLVKIQRQLDGWVCD